MAAAVSTGADSDEVEAALEGQRPGPIRRACGREAHAVRIE